MRLATCTLLACAALAPAQTDTDAVRKILASRIDEHKRSMGIVVAILDNNAKHIIAHGRCATGSPAPLDGDTVFEIGSITKAFTGLLLAGMARRGEVSLDDPAQKLLPEGVKLPQHGDRPITLRDLATHHSGLPRLPANLKPADPANPYADYAPPQLYEFLAAHTLLREPGAAYDYSNLGAGLLGHILSLRAGKTYEQLVLERICRPLRMNDTRIALTDSMRARLAPGHGLQLEQVKNWDFDALAGAGALRSTANDLLRLLEALLKADSAFRPRSGRAQQRGLFGRRHRLAFARRQAHAPAIP